MGTWKFPQLTEASGLAFSRKWAGIVYVINDENTPVYTANWSTGELVGSFSIKNRSTRDQETLSIDRLGMLTLGDTGNNPPSDPDVQPVIYRIREPGPGFHGALPWIRYPLRFPGGDVFNCETYFDRANGSKFLIDKEAQGTVYMLPALERGKTLQMKVYHGPDSDLAYVSDAVGQWDSQWQFVIQKDKQDVVSAFTRTWEKDDEFEMPVEMTKHEGLAISKDGRTLGVCDDKGGTGGFYQNVKVPKKYWPKEQPVTPPPPPPPTPQPSPCAA